MRKFWVLALVACGGPRNETVADGCYELASTLCARIDACGQLQGTISDCRTQGVQTCCVGADCGKPVSDYAFLDNCDTALSRETCGDIAANLQPVACMK